MQTHEQTGSGAGQKPAPPEDAGGPVLIDSLPMARYSFVVRGRLANGAEIIIKGGVYAKRGLYYQAQARVLDSVLREIPTLKLDEEAPVGLRMHLGKCAPPEDLSILGRPKSQSTVPLRAIAKVELRNPREQDVMSKAGKTIRNSDEPRRWTSASQTP
ncbi:hypothetical protein OH491_12715 [Termitidicoccus mucosus]|uniref:Uncharacterized protein n=1 Tax=Termitidicoccus mucosus TaxID=1184151 RepID=A0A178IHN8_9BACT|nr:hypothetical protein AW736_14750 [Opitutaceae bacterium TSB47]